MEYDFLNLFTKKDAFAKGIPFSKPEKHALLSFIDNFSSIKNAKKQQLLKYAEFLKSSDVKISEGQLLKVLVELKLDRLITIIPGLEYDEKAKKLLAVNYFVSAPVGTSYGPMDIYNEVVDNSAKAANDYYRNKDQVSMDTFWEDLEKNTFSKSEKPLKYKSAVATLDQYFEHMEGPLYADSDNMALLISDVYSTLEGMGSAVEVEGVGYCIFNEAVLPEVADNLTTFLHNKILSEYKDIPQIARELDMIAKQEDIFTLENRQKNTYSFIANKAASVSKYLDFDKFANDSVYPGKLPLILIQKIEHVMNDRYAKNNIDFIFEKFIELKQVIEADGNYWEELIHFFSEEELLEYPQEVVGKLRSDRSILSSTWETSKGTFQVFMHLKPDKLLLILKGLSKLSMRDAWRVLAYRKLLQNSSKIDPDLNPFNSPSFSEIYGKILRSTYTSLIPFYLNFLLIFRAKFIEDFVFKYLKKYIDKNQGELARKNNDKRDTLKAKSFKDLDRLKVEAKNLLLRNRILNELDFFYFKHNAVPTVVEVMVRVPGTSEDNFKRILKEYNFEIIAVNSGDGWKDKILFYPKNGSWQYVTERFDEMVSKYISARKIKNNADEVDEITKTRMEALKYRLHSLV